MPRNLLTAALLLVASSAIAAHAQDVAPSYGVPGYQGRVNSFVSLCPSADGTNIAVACGTPGAPTSVTIVGPDGPEGGVSVSITPFRADATNYSGAITVGGSWQQVIPSNPLRIRVFIQNRCSAAYQGISTTESMLLNVGPNMPTTTDGALEIATCGYYDSSSSVLNTQPVWLYAPTAGHKFVALQW